MPRESVIIRTNDGQVPTSVFTPRTGDGPWPAVIFYMDGLGIRPVLHEMGQRLADAGYVVVQPDLYYRMGPYEPFDPRVVFANAEAREAVGKYMGSTDNQRVARDTEAYLAYIDQRTDVAGRKVGTTGYCMGGSASLFVAGAHPDRIAAAASFHGGGLAADSDSSPHHLVNNIKGRVYIGAADNDSWYPPAMAGKLIQALMESSVEHDHELYVGAAHGWTMTDFPIYKADAAEQHWARLIALYQATLHS